MKQRAASSIDHIPTGHNPVREYVVQNDLLIARADHLKSQKLTPREDEILSLLQDTLILLRKVSPAIAIAHDMRNGRYEQASKETNAENDTERMP